MRDRRVADTLFRKRTVKDLTTRVAIVGLLVSALAGTVSADEGSVPRGIPQLDHVFVIMMENHAYGQIVNNPNAPFANSLMQSANAATNYFAIAHPSLTNYLEVVGGSNFGVQNDHAPDWHSTSCATNLASGTPSTESSTSPICPIGGSGTDAATPAIDYTNETSGLPGLINIDGVKSIPADHHIKGKTIADQLVAAGLSWKSYQESLPPSGPDTVTYSDGFYTDKNNLSNLVYLYAAKHNPFVYFRNVQEGTNPNISFKNIADFYGSHGLFDDLGSGAVPSYSFIAPNQCNDQHGRGNAGPVCAYDPSSNGTQTGLNPGLIYRGDVALQLIVNAIHHSPVWAGGRSAIVVLWDENDYSIAPTKNQVLLIVDTNYGARGVQSAKFYTHFSLLKSIEAGLGLPCLNHACDTNVDLMSDLFGNGE